MPIWSLPEVHGRDDKSLMGEKNKTKFTQSILSFPLSQIKITLDFSRAMALF
jgi:hypothetical protein